MKPILYKEGGIYWIIDGECRVRAMRSIGTERFLAEVYDDLDDAELARVEAAKAMVETDAKLGLTAEEKSRGVQTMLALDIPDEEVAVAARTDAGTVAKARRAARRVQDAAYDMTLDRLPPSPSSRATTRPWPSCATASSPNGSACTRA